jgi:RNA polymerase sigma factor (sigma-70 family)
MTSFPVMLEALLATGKLRRICEHLTSNRELQEELEQRCLTRAWMQREQFRGDSAPELEQWLRVIAHHEAVTYSRQEKSQLQRARHWLEKFQSWLTTDLPGQVEAHDHVQWLQAGLNDKERLVIKKLYFDQHTAEQIAQEWKMTVNSVYQIHHRALEKLRKREISRQNETSSGVL